MQEKGLLKQKVQEASVKPFFLQPHVFAVPVLKNSNPFPVSSLIGQKDKVSGSNLNANCSSPLVTFGVSPSPPATNSPFINFLRNSPTMADVRNHSPHQQPLATDFKKPSAQNYYPWFGLPSMFSTVSPVSPFSSATQASPNLSSIPPSPASMFHHPSPLTMLPKHNYPVCSVRNNDGIRSEYTVGPNHARPGELVVDETGSNSGRATPVSDSGDEGNDLLDNTELAPPNMSFPVASTSSITVTSASGKEPCVVHSSNYGSTSSTYARASITSLGSGPSSVCSQVSSVKLHSQLTRN